MTITLNKKQVIELAESHGLFVTDNSNTLHVAKNLITANKRILQLESILLITDEVKRKAAIFKYNSIGINNMKLTPFFKVITAPSDINGNFLVEFDNCKITSSLWVVPNYSVHTFDGNASILRDIEVGKRYRASFVGDSNVKVDAFQQDISLVHVGAKLMIDKDVEVMLLGDNDEVVIKDNSGDLSICLGEELSTRKTKEELTVEEMFDCISTDLSNDNNGTVGKVLIELVKAGYHK